MNKLKLLILGTILLVGAQACRSVQMFKSKADSTSVRSSQASEKWDREMITEYAVPQLPVIAGAHGIPDSTLLSVLKVFQQMQPKQQQPYVIRTTVRDSGEKQQASTEEKTAAVEQKVVEKEPASPWLFAGIGAGLMFLVLALLFAAYKIVKSRIISAIAKLPSAS